MASTAPLLIQCHFEAEHGEAPSIVFATMATLASRLTPNNAMPNIFSSSIFQARRVIPLTN